MFFVEYNNYQLCKKTKNSSKSKIERYKWDENDKSHSFVSLSTDLNDPLDHVSCTVSLAIWMVFSIFFFCLFSRYTHFTGVYNSTDTVDDQKTFDLISKQISFDFIYSMLQHILLDEFDRKYQIKCSKILSFARKSIIRLVCVGGLESLSIVHLLYRSLSLFLSRLLCCTHKYSSYAILFNWIRSHRYIVFVQQLSRHYLRFQNAQ